MGNTKSVAQWRIDQIESGRAVFWIIVASPCAHDVEAISMQMEGVRLK